MDPAALTDGIRLALAPVFLLTAVAAMIGAVATRLARIIDRARVIEDRIDANPTRAIEAAFVELERLRLRGRLVNSCMVLLTLCAMAIAVTIVALFLGETTQLHTSRWVSISFLSGIGLFVLALLGFLAETLFATHTLRFRERHTHPPGSGAEPSLAARTDRPRRAAD